MASADRLVWDATTVLEALGAADAALWVWEPDRDRLKLAAAGGAGPTPPPAIRTHHGLLAHPYRLHRTFAYVT